jgi:DNA-binding transcriptional ArsR family regulator
MLQKFMQVYEAIADPVRRRIIEMLASGERAAGDIAGQFPVSRPAISRHLRVLRDAGLITWRGDAQKRVYRLDHRPLQEVDQWLDRYRSFWNPRLDALVNEAETHDDDSRRLP